LAGGVGGIKKKRDLRSASIISSSLRLFLFINVLLYLSYFIINKSPLNIDIDNYFPSGFHGNCVFA